MKTEAEVVVTRLGQTYKGAITLAEKVQHDLSII